MNIKYIVSEKKNFGIIALNLDSGFIEDEIDDISANGNFVKNLAEKFNMCELSILHFRDAVMDSLE